MITNIELAEARKIVWACVQTKYSIMGMPGYETYRPLPTVSLEEMLVANRLVSDAGSTPDPEGGGRILHMTIAPRGLAALYVREMYRPEDAMEAMGWEVAESDVEDDED